MHGNGIFGVVEGRWLVVRRRHNNRGSAEPLSAMHGNVVHGVVRRQGLVARLCGSSRGTVLSPSTRFTAMLFTVSFKDEGWSPAVVVVRAVFPCPLFFAEEPVL